MAGLENIREPDLSISGWTLASKPSETTEVNREVLRFSQDEISEGTTVHQATRSCDPEEQERKAEDETEGRKSRSIKRRLRSLLDFVLNSGRRQGGLGGRGKLKATVDKKVGGYTKRRRSKTEIQDAAEMQSASTSQLNRQLNDTNNEHQNQNANPKPPQTTEMTTDKEDWKQQQLFPGGVTTDGHKRVQDMIFSECRVIPSSTQYKKVAMIPNHCRLFLSAPTNPRPNGSKFFYDIAYENRRHHADCNRDFTRTGLKKVCPNYCKPNQFRYVY